MAGNCPSPENNRPFRVVGVGRGQDAGHIGHGSRHIELKGSFRTAKVVCLPQPLLHRKVNLLHYRLPQLANRREALAHLECVRFLQQRPLEIKGHYLSPPRKGRDTLGAPWTNVTERGLKTEVLTGVTMGLLTLGPRIRRRTVT